MSANIAKFYRRLRSPPIPHLARAQLATLKVDIKDAEICFNVEHQAAPIPQDQQNILDYLFSETFEPSLCKSTSFFQSERKEEVPAAVFPWWWHHFMSTNHVLFREPSLKLVLACNSPPRGLRMPSQFAMRVVPTASPALRFLGDIWWLAMKQPSVHSPSSSTIGWQRCRFEFLRRALST